MLLVSETYLFETSWASICFGGAVHEGIGGLIRPLSWLPL
jgi:hypothetical protein